jgi:hypothetical protein
MDKITEASKALVLARNGQTCPHTLRAKTLGAFCVLDRTGRVRNEPMFGVAAKKTECALLTGRRSRLATGTCINKVERLMNGWATIRSPWKMNVAPRGISQCGKGVKYQPLVLSYCPNKYDCEYETNQSA